MNILEEAIIYATVLHQGKVRKFGDTPYILHPLEVAQILSTLTDDIEVITAGILHDIVEDTDGTLPEIEKRFGPRVAMLVSSESEEEYPDEEPGATWKRRKEGRPPKVATLLTTLAAPPAMIFSPACCSTRTGASREIREMRPSR